MNTDILIKVFKVELSLFKNIQLDFRSDVFIANNYGNYPQSLSYDTACIIVKSLYEWANDFVRMGEQNYPAFAGFDYNLSMTVESLRTRKLSDLIYNVCNDLAINYKKV